MKRDQIIFLVVLLPLLMGCSTPTVHSLDLPPRPPLEWEISLESKLDCSSVAGEYELVPSLAVLQKDGAWHISTGSWFQISLLMPFDRVDGDRWSPTLKQGAYSKSSLVFDFDTNEEAIQIISPVKNSDQFITHTLRKNAGDYTCKSGTLVFPEFQITGGTEGAVLNGRIYRHVNTTYDGSLLFYEKIQGQESIHKYFLFQKK